MSLINPLSISPAAKPQRRGASVDSIIFLTSLISDPQAVDSKLDTLRAITSRLSPNEALSADDQHQIDALQNELKDYLIKHDPIRSFTTATLEQTIASHFSGGAHQSVRKEFILIFSSIVVIYLLGVALSPASLPLLTHFLLAAPVMVALLYGAIAWLFLSSRQNFKTQIRNVYNYFCGGIIFGALGSMQFPLIFAFPQIAALPPFSYVGFVFPYFLMCLAFYLGTNLYARQLNLSQRLWSIPWVSGISLLIAVVLFSLPHSAQVTQPFFYELSLISVGVNAWLSLPASVLSFRVAKHVSSRYKQSMRFFGLGQVTQGLGCIGLTAILLINGPTPTVVVGIGAIPFVLSATLILISAYTFKLRSRT